MALDAMVIRQWRVDYSGVALPEVVLCRDDETWVRLWQCVRGDVPAPLRTNQLGVVIFIGQRPTGGYGASVISTEVTPNSYLVKYKEETPNAVVTEAVTTPCTFAIVPGTNLPIKVTKAGDANPSSANAAGRPKESLQDEVERVCGQSSRTCRCKTPVFSHKSLI
jgi:PrcB C-terminal